MTGDTIQRFADRLTLYCEAVQVQMPTLEFQDNELLLTADLNDWIKRQKISLLWLISGEGGIAREVEYVPFNRWKSL